jgi:L-lactate dehydrogenase complex protein LldF
VKSKSMLTEECGLNAYLEARGIEIVDSDLGERIVQLRGEPPSHIVLPAIHLRKEEVGELFHRELGTEAGLSDPTRLTAAARRHLRDKFLGAQAGITGVNFAIAETGGVVICTNEGNADLGTALPPLHIASMGIEKLIPRADDLGVFVRLLARSATGQPITAYTSHIHGPRPGGELHIVIVDNGRSQILSRPEYRQALACIRCGACLNTCPVYRRSGGYSYESVVPGPIGSTLGPALDPAGKRSLPYACTLCGSCTDVCPVKIDLDRQLYRWRRELVAGGHIEPTKKLAAAVAAQVLRRPRLYRLAGRLGRFVAGRWPRLAAALLPAWTASRDLPEIPERSFREQLEDDGDE